MGQQSEGRVERAEILPLMGVVKRSGEWMMGFCPSHDDGLKHGRKAGHSLGLSDAGVLRCFAGCAFGEVITKLRANEPRKEPQRPGGTWPREPKIAYEYRDAEGVLVGVKGRFERPDPDGGKAEKTFRWRLPESTEYTGLGGKKIADMPLWGIELLSKPGPVWFAEGESATAAIRARNEIALCGPWGASQREFGTAFEVLRNRDVILWPDNDVAGRDYMAEVKRHLRGIAKSVVTVQAPVPPKGDAVEYFQAGGTIEELLSKVVVRPTVDVAGIDHFIVRVPTETGPVAFDFDNMAKSGSELTAELTVQHLNPGFESEAYAQRINLLSLSARGQIETALGRQFGKETNWTLAVNTAWSRARSAFLEQDRGAQIGSLGNVETLSFLVETLFPENQPTIVFGDGSSNKTYILYCIGAHIALGAPHFIGMPIKHKGGVLIVDYETGGEQARFRMKRILLGMGQDPNIVDELLTMLPIHYWDAKGIPFADQVDAIQRFCEKQDIAYMIVDSGADACGGEPEKPLSALTYFNALSRIKVTSVTICHITNADAESSSQRPFGSRFWHNRARRTWFVKRDQEEESDELDVALICRKVNDGRRPASIALKVNFEGENGAVRFGRQDFREVVAFEAEGPAADRVLRFLTSHGAPATAIEIAQGLDLDIAAVKTALNRGKGSKFLQVNEGTGRGHQTHWAALAREA